MAFAVPRLSWQCSALRRTFSAVRRDCPRGGNATNRRFIASWAVPPSGATGNQLAERHAVPVTRPTPIALVMSSFDPGGTERQMIELVRRLDRERWDVHLACLAARGTWMARA